jgi:hypothetical protein
MKNNQKLAVMGQAPRNDANPLGVALIDPQSVEALPLAQYYRMAGNFVNVQSAIYYDTAVYRNGTAITQDKKKALFTKGKAQDDVRVNDGTAIPEKGDFLTNMISDGEFEGGTTFILEQICVHWLLTSEQPTTTGVRNEITAPNYTASSVIAASIHHKAIQENFVLEYYRNEEMKLRGKLRHFPSPFGASGAFGDGSDGFIQNGFNPNGFNMLSRPIVLQSEDKFSFVLQPVVATWTPTIDFNITVELIGKTIKTFVP